MQENPDAEDKYMADYSNCNTCEAKQDDEGG
jgi:hypothetical protein